MLKVSKSFSNIPLEHTPDPQPTVSHLANGPCKKKFELNFPTKHAIPKSLKFSHWPSKVYGEGIPATFGDLGMPGVCETGVLKKRPGCLRRLSRGWAPTFAQKKRLRRAKVKQTLMTFQ